MNIGMAAAAACATAAALALVGALPVAAAGAPNVTSAAASSARPSYPSAAMLNLGATPIVLLGEVHDNARQHALRLDAFRSLLESGARPALLMEQLDRDRQPAIDAARTKPDADAAEVFAAGSPGGWSAAFYEPFIALAVRYGLPIVAANVSRADARRVMQQGLAAQGFDAAVPRHIEAAHSADIEASHCGLIDPASAGRMAQAQVARDQFMARMIEANADRGVVLLAGNGHVRKNIGVPHWLDAATRKRSRSIGLLEAGDPSAKAFDVALTTPRQPREDPCRAMKDSGSASRPR